MSMSESKDLQKKLQEELGKKTPSQRALAESMLQAKTYQGQMAFCKELWKTGRNPLTGEEVSFKDTLSFSNHMPIVMPIVVSEVIRESIEPLLRITPLFERMAYRPKIEVVYGATGAVSAAMDLAPEQEYPELSLQVGGHTMVAEIGKVGIGFRIHEDVERNAEYPIVNLYLSEAAKAMARHKERKAIIYLESLGMTLYDNKYPLEAVLGTTSGRNLAGAQNGSLHWDDMMEAQAAILGNGFEPNLLIVHPLCWSMMMKDPLFRVLVLQSSANGSWWGSYSGNAAHKAPWSVPSYAAPSIGQNVVPMGSPTQTPTPASSMPHLNTQMTAPNFPAHYAAWPFEVMASTMLDFDTENKLTDMILCDRREIGYLLVEHDVMVENWQDIEREFKKWKLKERYAFFVKHEGRAIGVLKNIKAEANQIVTPGVPQIDVGSLSAVTRTTAVV